MNMPLDYIMALDDKALVDEVFSGTYDVSYLEMELANRVALLTEALADMEARIGNHA